MTNYNLIAIVALFFVTSVIGVVTGSNSLITVPVMFQFGIEERVAIATNMFGLTFMAIGGTIPFLRQGSIDTSRIAPLAALTAIGSALGAMLVSFVVTGSSMKVIVSVAMFVVVGFTLLRPAKEESRSLPLIGYPATFLLAVYGGLYSGGYVTILTACFVAFLGMNYVEAVGSTKLVNVFSSLVATLVFMWQGLVDYSLGSILAVTMFVGAYVGAHFASRMPEDRLRQIFLASVVLLAIKTIYDLL